MESIGENPSTSDIRKPEGKTKQACASRFASQFEKPGLLSKQLGKRMTNEGEKIVAEKIHRRGKSDGFW